MKKAKLIAKCLLVVISIYVGLFTFNLLNVEKLSLFIGGTHIHENPRAPDSVLLSPDSRIDAQKEKHIDIQSKSGDLNVHTETFRPDLIRGVIVKYSGAIAPGEGKSPASNDTQSPKNVSPSMQEDSRLTPHSKDIKPILRTASEDTLTAGNPCTITFTGWLKTKNSRDTHTFRLNDSCEADISFTPSEGDKAYYNLTIKDESGHVLTRKMIDSENLHTGTGKLYLRPGAYTVNIERGYSWSGKPYKITIIISHTTNAEQENNNSPNAANIIPLNEDVKASSGTANDTDYFTFMLDRPMMICPRLEFDEVMNGKEVYSLKFYELRFLDTDIRPFVFRGDSMPSRKIKPFVLEAGKYIIAVSRLEPEELELGLHEYILRVEAQELM